VQHSGFKFQTDLTDTITKLKNNPTTLFKAAQWF